mmetsp:Transcript_37041/g.69246  ORF Transcript_37041/g.69246 Transcript_37041/m.69246 type:complete len:83 (+) Transcript_37041:257-505(+)
MPPSEDGSDVLCVLRGVTSCAKCGVGSDGPGSDGRNTDACVKREDAFDVKVTREDAADACVERGAGSDGRNAGTCVSGGPSC